MEGAVLADFREQLLDPSSAGPYRFRKEKYEKHPPEVKHQAKIKKISKGKYEKHPPAVKHQTKIKKKQVSEIARYFKLAFTFLSKENIRNSEVFGMNPDTYKIRNMRAMPHVTRGADVMGIYSEDKVPMGQYTGQMQLRQSANGTEYGTNNYQQLFVDPTFEMVLQRYEDISPPDNNYQKELTKLCNEPIDLHKNPSITAAENTRSNKSMTTVQQNTEKISYSQTNQYFETYHDKNDILAIENIGVPPQNISEMQPLFNLPTSDPALQVCQWRDAELPQPFLYPQLELPQVAPFMEVARNAQYMPVENINRIQEDVRELPQNFIQSTQQKFNQSYQRYEEMTQNNMYPQIPPYFDQNLYNPRLGQPSRSEYHQMPKIRGPQHRKTLPRPYYVPGQSTNNNTRGPKVQQQRLMVQQQAYLQSTTQQQPSQTYWSHKQQLLLEKIYKHQRLRDLYQDMLKN